MFTSNFDSRTDAMRMLFIANQHMKNVEICNNTLRAIVADGADHRRRIESMVRDYNRIPETGLDSAQFWSVAIGAYFLWYYDEAHQALPILSEIVSDPTYELLNKSIYPIALVGVLNAHRWFFNVSQERNGELEKLLPEFVGTMVRLLITDDRKKFSLSSVWLQTASSGAFKDYFGEENPGQDDYVRAKDAMSHFWRPEFLAHGPSMLEPIVRSFMHRIFGLLPFSMQGEQLVQAVAAFE